MANFITRTVNKFGSEIVKRSGGFMFTNFGTPMWSSVGMENKSNVLVNADTANKLSAFYSCVRNISEDIAKLPVRIYTTDAKGNKKELRNHPASKLLNISPNSFTNPFTLEELLFDRSLRKGDGFALIVRDADAVPIQILFLEYEVVIPVISHEGEKKLWYIINDPIMQIYGTYPSEDVMHLRGLGNAYRGLSVLRYASESIGRGIATQDYAGKFYGSGANMTGLLKIVGAKTGPEANEIKNNFMRSYQNDGVGALQGSAEFTKMNFSADEAQMLASQEFTVKDVARWFRMPLSKLQTSDQVANIEALAIEYVTDCLMPWIVRFEQEIASKLFTEQEKKYLTCVIDTGELLRGDSAAQERRIKTNYFTGAWSPNDVLRYQNLNVSDAPGMDEHFYPVNQVPESKVLGFWEAKDQSKTAQNNSDPSGTGVGAISQKSKRLQELTSELLELSKIMES